MKCVLLSDITINKYSISIMKRSPLNILSLEAYLKYKGWNGELCLMDSSLILGDNPSKELTADLVVDTLASKVLDAKPDILGMSTYADSLHLSLDIAERVKKQRG